MNMKTTYPVIAALAAFALPLFGQEPLVVGNFENAGSITTGYRFTDVSGYKPKYQELFDLNSGIRLLENFLTGDRAPVPA